MKFKFGDEVIYENEFATYFGRITAHKVRTSWPWFWRKTDFYLIDIETVNGEFAQGSVAAPESHIKWKNEPAPLNNLYPVNTED